MTTKRGYALMLTLWIVLIFTVLAMTFFYQSYVNAKVVRSQFNRMEAKNMAMNGLAMAVTDLKNDCLWENYSGETAYDGMDGNRKYDAKCDIWFEEPYYHQKNYPDEDNEDSWFQVRVVPLNTKININKVDQDFIEAYFNKIDSDMDEEEIEDLAEAIIDWRDKDETLQEEEEDEIEHYNEEDIDNPTFIPFNRDFEIIEELMQVKDLTPEIFYGINEDNLEKKRVIRFNPYHYYFSDEDDELEEEKNGLLDVFTVYNDDNKINVNFADRFMLELIVEAATQDESSADSIVDYIIDYRDDSDTGDYEDVVPYKAIADLEFSGTNVPPEASKYLCVNSKNFKIIAVGHKKQAQYTIIAHVTRSWEEMQLVDDWDDKWDSKTETDFVPRVRITSWTEK